jgi:nitroreductase
MDGLEMLYTRRSVRSFSDEPIGDDILQKIIRAGRLAATARNLQPVELVIVKNKALNKKIAAITDYGKFIAQAAVCLVLVSEDTKYYLEDGSACAENILLAARYFGIGSCWVAGDKKVYAPKIVDLVELPPSYKLVSLIALGYPKSKGTFFEKDLKRKSSRIIE